MPNSSKPFAIGPSLDVIRASAARMWFVSALGRGGAQFIQLLATAVLARLLMPEDFGIVVLATVFIGLADILRDFGLSAATVRAPDLKQEDASGIFVINLFLGVAMTVLGVLCAPIVGEYFNAPQVVSVIQVLSLSFFIGSIGAQHQALLRRQLKFGLLAKINLLVVLAGQVVAISMAIAGYSYWSLVAGTLVTGAGGTIAVWVVNPWRPRRPSLSSNTKEMLKFGGYLALFGLMGFMAKQSNYLVLAGKYGISDIGYYSRAMLILDLALGYVMAPLATVVPATLSKVLHDSDEYKSMYLHFLAMSLCLAAPIGMLLVLTAGDVVRLVLGANWQASVFILQILALSAIPRMMGASSGWLYQSHGDSRRMMLWGLIGWVGLLFALLVGAQFGVRGVAIAYSVAMLLLLYPCLQFAFHKTSLHFVEVLIEVRPFVLAAVLAFIPAIALSLYFHDGMPLLRLPLLATVYLVFYLCLLIYCFNKKAMLQDFLRQLFATKNTDGADRDG